MSAKIYFLYVSFFVCACIMGIQGDMITGISWGKRKTQDCVVLLTSWDKNQLFHLHCEIWYNLRMAICLVARIAAYATANSYSHVRTFPLFHWISTQHWYIVTNMNGLFSG